MGGRNQHIEMLFRKNYTFVLSISIKYVFGVNICIVEFGFELILCLLKRLNY